MNEEDRNPAPQQPEIVFVLRLRRGAHGSMGFARQVDAPTATYVAGSRELYALLESVWQAAQAGFPAIRYAAPPG